MIRSKILIRPKLRISYTKQAIIDHPHISFAPLPRPCGFQRKCDLRQFRVFAIIVGSLLLSLAAALPANAQSRYEAEDASLAAWNGPTPRIVSDPNYSTGQAIILDATAPGNFVTFLLPNIAAGKYNVTVGVKKASTRGTWQLYAGRADNFNGTRNLIGPVYDEYSPTDLYTSVDLGTWSPSTTSDKWFQFYVTGKNGSSTDYLEAIDYIKVTPVVPNGAAALGYTQLVINERPVASDLAPARNGNYKWFRGIYYSQTQPPTSDFNTVNGMLAISLHGGMVSTPLDFTTGALPVLSGAKGFYVEYEVALSDNNSDHWPAVWAEPMEHNLQQSDHYAGDPSGFERWMELDVDEGGFGPGTCSTVINWTGIYPNYVKQQNGNNVSSKSLDRTQWHTYGASYDPVHSKVAWWLDGVQIVSATSPNVPAIAAQQHFYMIINAQTHGAEIPYTMYVGSVKAYTAP